MISGATSCYPNVSQGLQLYSVSPENMVSSSFEANLTSENHSSTLLYSLSVLKEKLHQVQSMVGIFVSSVQSQTESSSIALASMNTLVQEIIVTASSMMLTCQHMAAGAGNNADESQTHRLKLPESRLPGHQDFGKSQAGNNMGHDRRLAQVQGFCSRQSLDWYAPETQNNNNNNTALATGQTNNPSVEVGYRANTTLSRGGDHDQPNEGSQHQAASLADHCDIVELNAADLLAMYTHYCRVCGKGFKRDANLRMHMRAHGDEYKTSAALSNPLKNKGAASSMGDEANLTKSPRKYSCPHEGCRWNRKHAKFQPLKSIICVKNHYKRSHCPKMYVCKRCNRKQFAVLSDLRTHEKHCGDLKWLCSCGTTFSRKDKLMGHISLFVGHTPVLNSVTTRPEKPESQDGKIGSG